MATSMTTILQAGLAPEALMPAAGQIKRRRIDPQSGRALVILGHAIEYLADEFVFAARSLSANRGQLEAIQLLMAKNRDIYLGCPEVPTFRQWLQALLIRQHKDQADARGKLGSEFSHDRI